MTDAPESKRGWFGRLRDGLKRSSQRLTQGISAIFTKRRLDDETLEELEELLIAADLGPATAARLAQGLADARYGKEVTVEDVKQILSAQVRTILDPVARPLDLDGIPAPAVVLVVGVNGAGKTTTIGKLAKQQKDQGKRVVVAAGDTFRAAAVEQLQIWGERAGVPVIAKGTGSDAAGVAFDALTQAKDDGADVVFIDTAGRLQNKNNLMQELVKIRKVTDRVIPGAPHHVLLVLDATTGQNAITQVEVFKQIVQVTGLILTKIDGSAKGGILVALADRFGLPVHAVGVGESIEDLRPFDPEDFARSLLDLDDFAER